MPKGLFGASGFESKDTEPDAPITSIKVNSLIVGAGPGATLPAGRPVKLTGLA